MDFFLKTKIFPAKFCEIVKKRFKITYEYDYPYLNILDSWKILPGTTKNNIDKLYLFGWYEKCCELLNNEDLEYVDRIIGIPGRSHYQITNSIKQAIIFFLSSYY